MTTISLYIHIPFCVRKCRYCSFVSYAGRLPDIPAYITALNTEMALRSRGEQISSIYFGGGTPSLLTPAHIQDILNNVRSRFRVEDGAEITMEANPGTIDVDYLSTVRKSGVNRLSLGVQSFNDHELTLLGRIHTADEARNAVKAARSAGFENLGIDLIYGQPGIKDSRAWKDTLSEAVRLNPEHISLYALTLEHDTPMQADIERGEIPAIDPDRCADEYELAEDLLSAEGYNHYEISNWAKPGFECRHNITYWQNREWLGLGCAAHSYMDARRFANTANLDGYVSALMSGMLPPLDLDDKTTPENSLAETVFMGLRLDAGIKIDDLKERYGKDLPKHYGLEINELTECGLLERSNDKIRLTRKGRLLGNEVFCRFLPE